MPTLYVTETASRLEKEYDRLLVTKHDEVLLSVPLRRVTQVVLVGYVGATTAALNAIIDAEIPLLIVNRSGKLRSRLIPPTGGNLPLRQRQYARNEEQDFSLALARAVVTGKIRNQRTLALRLARRHHHIDATADLEQLQHALDVTIAAAPDLATLRGIEGYHARLYFRVFRQAFAEKWQFRKRNRRPPKDPVNVLLSLGYSMLTNSAITALEVVGLDPYLGYFHTEKYNRPALALDLVEEFRAPIVDSLTLNLLNRKWLREQHFRSATVGDGMLLTEQGLHHFFMRFSEKLESAFFSRQLQRKITYRKMLEVQARALANVILAKQSTYLPFRLR